MLYHNQAVPEISDFIEQLHSAIAGLTYPSESDESFAIITLPASPTSFAAIEACTTRRPIEREPVERFFLELRGDPQAEKLDAVDDLFTLHLQDIGVFRVGDGGEVEIYLVGRAATGEWVGMKTLSVET